MPARRRDLDRATNAKLAFDLGEIGLLAQTSESEWVRHGGQRGEAFLAREESQRRVEAVDRHGLDAVDERGFLGGGARQDDTLEAGAFGVGRQGHAASDRTDLPAEPEFAGKEVMRQPGLGDLPGRGGQPDRDRQVVHRAFLAEVAGREVDGRHCLRRAEPGIDQGRDDPGLGLLDRGVG